MLREEKMNKRMMNKRVVGIILALFMMLTLVACAQTDNTQATKTVTDIAGNAVEIPSEINTVVSIAPNVTEIIFALDSGDKLIGVDAFSNYPSEASKIESVGDYNGPNVESIVDLNADVVIGGNYLQQETIDGLNELSIPIIQAEGTTFEEIYQSIVLIGEVLDKESEATELVDSMKARKKAVEDKAAKNKGEKPSVYYVMTFADGNWTSGPGTFINEMIESAGGTCVTADGGAEWMDYSMEELIEKDPEVLLVSSEAGDIEELKKTTGYSSLSAVKNDKVFVIDADIVSRPGPRIIDALEDIYEAINS